VLRLRLSGERDAEPDEPEEDGEEDVLHDSNRTPPVSLAASAR
jgi:hypothetical protein